MRCRACATGEDTLNALFETAPFSGPDMMMLITMPKISEARMPIGRSRCGLRASAVAVDTASKPRRRGNGRTG